MDQLDEKPMRTDLGYVLAMVAVLAAIATSLALQLLALKDDDQVALAQAAQALVRQQSGDDVKLSEPARKS
jgi:hypothetical protein